MSLCDQVTKDHEFTLAKILSGTLRLLPCLLIPINKQAHCCDKLHRETHVRDPQAENPVKLLLDTIYIRKKKGKTKMESAVTKNSQEFCFSNLMLETLDLFSVSTRHKSCVCVQLVSQFFQNWYSFPLAILLPFCFMFSLFLPFTFLLFFLFHGM